MAKSTVYFTNDLTPEAVVKMYRQLGIELPGRVAVKVHSGEDGNQNYLHPAFMKPVIDAVNGTVVECNTAYGGALKQLSIGCASSAGKAHIHSGGKVTDQNILWENCAEQDTFLEAMADAASTVAKHFAGKIAYVAIMKNLSVDCDCCAVAEDPCMNDVGILSSLDPVALDRACIDLVINSNDPGRDHFMERVNSRHGTHTIDTAETLGIGTQAYELVKV